MSTTIREDVPVLPDHTLLLHSPAAEDGDRIARPLMNVTDVLVIIPTANRPKLVARRISEIPEPYSVLILATSPEDLPEPAALNRSGLHIQCTPDLYDLGAGRPRYATPHPDLAGKRNHGLWFARNHGYRAAIFIDDDIDISGELIERLIGGLRSHTIAAAVPIGYADRSTLYRFLHDAGFVRPFISGSCLAVHLDYRGWFPTIYNEDWFFMIPALCDKKVISVGTCRHSDHSPVDLDRADRAGREELGDLLAEGVFAALHGVMARKGGRCIPVEALIAAVNDAEFWEQERERRLSIHTWVARRTRNQEGRNSTSDPAVLWRARQVLESLTPIDLAGHARDLVVYARAYVGGHQMVSGSENGLDKG